jgi:hypothetical protein
MSEEIGTIRFLEGKIITKKEGVTQVWTKNGGDPNSFIVWNDTIWRLHSTK